MKQGRRLYILQRPKIGSLNNPKASLGGCEASQYYWWWYALTLSDDYIECCNNGGTGPMSSLYKDFGDVRYDGKAHIAFVDWWHILVNGEARGAYLFAEPLLEKGMRLVTDADDAQSAIEDPTQALISIPLDVTRVKLMKMIKRRIEAIHEGKQGKDARSLKSSQALYIARTAAQPTSVKLQLAVYKQRKEWDEIGKRYDNALIAKKLGITVETSDVAGTGDLQGEISAADNARAVSTKVSKLNSQAKKMIVNVGKGIFP
jgi:hypothetical protein